MLTEQQRSRVNSAHYTSTHNHTHFSNIRLLDSTNKPEALIDRAVSLNYNGIAITDHESLGGLPDALWYVEKQKKSGKIPEDFRFILGNELYVVNDLTRTRVDHNAYKAYKNGFYHLILLAKDYKGYEQLKLLSSMAWENSYTNKKMIRTPVDKKQLYEVVSKDPGHLICSTACLGGYLAKILMQKFAEQQNINKYQKLLQNKQTLTKQTIERYMASYEEAIDSFNNVQQDLKEFFDFYTGLFGEDFFLEIQPSNNIEQVFVNKELIQLGKSLNIPWIITTDAHYLSTAERPIHKAYLNSKTGEREVDDFYATTYVMEREELVNYLVNNGIDFEDAIKALENTQMIYDKVEQYTLEKGIQLPRINVEETLQKLKECSNIQSLISNIDTKMTSIFDMINHESTQNQYYIYTCLDGLVKKKIKPFESSFVRGAGDVGPIPIERINSECEELIEISKELGVDLSQYYVAMQKMIDLMWTEGDTLVGCGRGSVGSWYTAYLMDISDTNPLEWDLQQWRHIDRSKVELSDIDIDTQALRRQQILQAMKKYFGHNNVLNICTYGTEGSKSALIVAARSCGYDPDVGIYLSSLIPIDRGFPRSLKQCYEGDSENDWSPVTELINQVAKYPGVKEIAFGVEGLINKSGVHAAAIVIYNDHYVNHTPMMKARNGQYVTQYDMHVIDRLGGVKFDFLTIEALDIMRTCLDMLIEDELIEKQPTLRQLYRKYLHPDVLEYDDVEMWKLVDTGQIASLFQYSTTDAIAIARRLQPRSLLQLATGNALMRLMAPAGQMSFTDKYISFRDNPQLWEDEMNSYQLNEDQKEILREMFHEYYGVTPFQEYLQIPLMDKRLWKYDVGKSSKVRKVISKKIMEDIPKIREQLSVDGIKEGLSENFVRYIWDKVYTPQLGYAFPKNHSISYSIIALQELNLAYRYPVIYWNCACLCIHAGIADEEFDDNFTLPPKLTAAQVDNEEEEDKHFVLNETDDELEELPDELKEEIRPKKKVRATNYAKIAIALNSMISHGIKISPPDINSSKFDFRPNAKDNEILYSFKSIDRIGDNLIKDIVAGQPYSSFEDFVSRIKVNRTQIINLIKSGSFDKISGIPKRKLLQKYLSSIADTKSKLTLANTPTLIKNNLLDDPAISDTLAKYVYNKQLRAKQTKEDKTKLILDKDDNKYIQHNYLTQYPGLIANNGNQYYVDEKAWKKIYDIEMETLRIYLRQNSEELLDALNQKAVDEVMDKYAQGTESEWEMKSISFYYSGHELAGIDNAFYSIRDFDELPEEPEVSFFTQWQGRSHPIYYLNTIAGTVIGKNKLRHTVAILTTGGVVHVKFHKENFSFFDKQISEKNPVTGKRKVMERSWFQRGNKIIITGIRRLDQFIPKVYRNTQLKALYLIESIDKNGQLTLRDARYQPQEG